MKYSNVLLTATTTTVGLQPLRLTTAPKDGNFHFGAAFSGPALSVDPVREISLSVERQNYSQSCSG